jgi:hypothetical protein
MKLNRLPAAFLFALLVSSVASPAFADSRPPQFLIGFTFSHLKFDDPSGVAARWRNSFTIGFGAPVPGLPVDRAVSLRMQFILVPRGGDLTEGLVLNKLKMNYLDTMGLVDFRLPGMLNGNNVHVLVGPTFSVRIGGHRIQDGFQFDISGDVERIDAGITAGVQAMLIPKRLDLQVFYTVGLLDVFRNATNNARNTTLYVMFAPTFR